MGSVASSFARDVGGLLTAAFQPSFNKSLLFLAGLFAGVVSIGLSLFGFGSSGIVAGSAAAAMQSTIGNVAAGSAFATLQSLGASGTFVAVGTLGAGAAGVGAGLLALGDSPYDFDDDDEVDEEQVDDNNETVFGNGSLDMIINNSKKMNNNLLEKPKSRIDTPPKTTKF